jgi:membrane-associated phospholipid phosphatase
MLFFWRSARPWVRAGLVAYPILMCVTLVYAAEHYVVDVLMGWIYAAVAFVIGGIVIRRRAARSARGHADAEAGNQEAIAA